MITCAMRRSPNTLSIPRERTEDASSSRQICPRLHAIVHRPHRRTTCFPQPRHGTLVGRGKHSRHIAPPYRADPHPAPRVTSLTCIFNLSPFDCALALRPRAEHFLKSQMGVGSPTPSSTTTTTTVAASAATAYLDLTRPFPLGPVQGLPYTDTPPLPPPCLGSIPQTVDRPENRKRSRQTGRQTERQQ